MQARKDSREPLNKRPFDLQEAVVLLDVYLDMVKNGTSITKAAEKASVRLRNLAKRNGYEISDSYRSAGGLVNRLRSLGGLYEGQESKSAPGTPMFAEVVSLYKNNRARYEEILSTEKSVASQDGQNSGEQRAAHGKATAKEERRKMSMAEISNPAEQEFFQWLPTAVTSSVLKDIQKSYAQINVLLIKSRALTQTLTSVTSTDEVEFALRRTKKTFANKRLRNTAVQLLAAYIVYLREKEKAPETQNIGMYYQALKMILSGYSLNYEKIARYGKPIERIKAVVKFAKENNKGEGWITEAIRDDYKLEIYKKPENKIKDIGKQQHEVNTDNEKLYEMLGI